MSQTKQIVAYSLGRVIDNIAEPEAQTRITFKEIRIAIADFKAGIAIFLGLFLLCNFVLSAKIQSSNSELQRLKSKIDTQEKLNASMQMKINELACLDNALEVADTFGLEYNNSNIRVISEN